MRLICSRPLEIISFSAVLNGKIDVTINVICVLVSRDFDISSNITFANAATFKALVDVYFKHEQTYFGEAIFVSWNGDLTNNK